MQPTRAAVLVALLLSGCGPPLPPKSEAFFTNLPLDERGLPPQFSLCVRNRAEKETQVYDIFYPCSPNLGAYVVRINGMDPTQKSELYDDLTKRGLNYAHDIAVARWGEKARPPITQPATPPQPMKPSEPVPIIVGPPEKMPPGELRF